MNYIDENNFNTLFPIEFREEVETNLVNVANTEKSDLFFGKELKDFNLRWRGKNRKNFNNDIEIMGDIWISNIYTLDFITKFLNKDSVILDFCSGMGQMIVYLNKIGYNNVYGYDDFSQIEKEKVLSFLKIYNLEDRMISLSEVENKKYDLVINSDLLIRSPILNLDYRYIIPCYRGINLGMDSILKEFRIQKFFDNKDNELKCVQEYETIMVLEK
tara:strand:- start:2749 stop:3396 length:648 start_codon:yes stop_codon:yes gene_type:complete